jgi:serralysin
MADYFGTDGPDMQSGGFDAYYPGSGDDAVSGGPGPESFFGGLGNDALAGGPANASGAGTIASPLVIFSTGPSGDDLLDGGPGRDILFGFEGNDALFGGDGGDSGLLTLRVGGNPVGVVRYGLFGGDGADFLDGGRGDDYLDGGAGADHMLGGPGNDTFIVDNARDRITEARGYGVDLVRASVSYVMAPGAWVEVLQTSNAAGAGAIDLTGSDGSERIEGNAGNNVLRGGGGHDQLFGFRGNDILAGGAGNDDLNAGSGQNAFLFDAAIGSQNVDHITTFRRANDTIRLDDAIFKALPVGVLDPEALAYGTHASEADDRIIYNRANGYLLYDADGTGVAPPIKFAVIDAHNVVLADDFLVV